MPCRYRVRHSSRKITARTVPHRDMGALVEQRHGDRLEIVLGRRAADRTRRARPRARGGHDDVTNGPAAAADIGHASESSQPISRLATSASMRRRQWRMT